MNVQHVNGAAAVQLLNDPSFVDAWTSLLAACPWGTGFQSPHFVRTWYAHYRERFAPYLLLARDADGRLIGLLTLGAADGGRFVVAGDWQAEYHAWVSRPEDGDAFVVAALAGLEARQPLRFRYLPPGAPTGWLARPEFARRHALHTHPRPLYALGDGSDARSSLKKSGNKKRLKMLGEVGPITLKHLREPDEVRAALDQMIPLHDARHAAVRGSSPFRNDPRKRSFYLGLLSDPDLLHMSALYAGERLVAGHIGVRTGGDLQFGVLAHDPTHSRASPGKFLIYYLAQRLTGEGFTRFDLTAGGEGYKDRFANGGDSVHTLELFPTAAGRLAAQVKRVAVGRARAAIEARGLSRDGASAFAHSALAVRSWLGSRDRLSAQARGPDAGGGLVAYHGSLADLPAGDAGAVRHDDLAGMLDDAAPLSRWARRRFFSAAMRRMEMGQHCLSVSRGGRLAHVAWVEVAPPPKGRPVLPCPASVVVWELRVAAGVDAADAVRVTLAAVREGAPDGAPDARVCVVVDAGDGPVSRALEALNFRAAGPVVAPAEAPPASDGDASDAAPAKPTGPQAKPSAAQAKSSAAQAKPAGDKTLVSTKKEPQ